MAKLEISGQYKRIDQIGQFAKFRPMEGDNHVGRPAVLLDAVQPHRRNLTELLKDAEAVRAKYVSVQAALADELAKRR
ncbi:hypothetical protein BRPE67_FCDS01510 (plasmid) [Caballeronia cordobensis]|nr:hypothetical protein BRPE67_FCDS01510 [Burkholderia sp. RPE67]